MWYLCILPVRGEITLVRLVRIRGCKGWINLYFGQFSKFHWYMRIKWSFCCCKCEQKNSLSQRPCACDQGDPRGNRGFWLWSIQTAWRGMGSVRLNSALETPWWWIPVQCGEDQPDDKQCHWHPERDKGKRAEVGHCNELQVPWSSCFRWWLQKRGSLKDCTSHCSSYKTEAHLER